MKERLSHWAGLGTVQSAGSSVKTLRAVIIIANTSQCIALHNAALLLSVMVPYDIHKANVCCTYPSAHLTGLI